MAQVAKSSIFLSHSSKDKEMATALRTLILKKTRNMLNVFCSSDGESIPFGRNWVHTIEKGLSQSISLFVLLTPRSVYSTWVPFEAGIAYNRGIKVIPMCIDGISLSEMSGPLTLIQGFDIKNYEGLNNIISVINRDYGTTFDEDMTATDFDKVVSPTASTHSFNSNIHKIVLDFKHQVNIKEPETLARIYFQHGERLKALGVQHTTATNSLILPGMRLNYAYNSGTTINGVEAILSPRNLKENFDIVIGLITDSPDGPRSLKHCSCTVYFRRGINVPMSQQTITSILADKCKVTPSKTSYELMEYKGVSFLVDCQAEWYVNIMQESSDNTADTILELVNLLFERDVLVTNRT